MASGNDEAQAVDGSVLTDLLENAGAAAFARFIRDFTDVAPQRLSALRTALEAGDTADLEAAAHTLRGSALYLGLRRVIHLCKQLESCALPADLAQARETLADLEQALPGALEALTARLPT
jgi:HPt (histidine-containing phosphotransfer) domain-containing protein